MTSAGNYCPNQEVHADFVRILNKQNRRKAETYVNNAAVLASGDFSHIGSGENSHFGVRRK